MNHLTVNVDVDVPDDFEYEEPEEYDWDVWLFTELGDYKTGLSVIASNEENALSKAEMGLLRVEEALGTELHSNWYEVGVQRLMV